MSYREWEEQEALKSKSKASTVQPSMPARRAIRATPRTKATDPVPRESKRVPQRRRGPESPPRPADNRERLADLVDQLRRIGVHVELRLAVADAEEHQLRQYLAGKISRGDWHGVSDAANDLRDIVAEREELLAIKALLA